MIKSIWEWICGTFTASPTTEFEDYLASKNIKSASDLDFWSAQYEERRRAINRCLSSGDTAGAMHLRNFY